MTGDGLVKKKIVGSIMLKKLIYSIIFLVSINLAFAIYGGESFNLYSGECAYLNLSINIEPYQDLNEYSFNRECEFISLGNYRCDCENNYIDLSIIPKANSVGKYKITTFIFKEEEEHISSGSSSYYSPSEIYVDLIRYDIKLVTITRGMG